MRIENVNVPRPHLTPVVTLLLVVVLSLALWHAAAVTAGIIRQPVWGTLTLTPPPALIGIFNGFWSGTWLLAGLGLWRGWPRFQDSIGVGFSGYAASLIALQAAFVKGGYERGYLPAMAALLLLLSTVLVVGPSRPVIRKMFTGIHKRSDVELPQRSNPK